MGLATNIIAGCFCVVMITTTVGISVIVFLMIKDIFK